MVSIIVRGLDASVKSQLAAQAAKNGRSMEAEARRILTEGVSRPNIGIALMDAAKAVGGIEDLPVPPRNDTAKSVDFR